MMRWSRLQNRPTDRRQILISLSEELSKNGRRERRLYPQLNQTFSSGSNGWWLQIRRRGNDSTHTHPNHKSNWYWRSNFVPWALESNQEKACYKKVQKFGLNGLESPWIWCRIIQNLVLNMVLCPEFDPEIAMNLVQPNGSERLSEILPSA